MSESKTNTVTIEGRTFAASRPAILPVLRGVSAMDRGWHVCFRGTQDELMAAGVAFPEMFDDLRVKRSRSDEFGDSYDITREKSGRFKVERWLRAETCTEVETGQGLHRGSNMRARKRWIEGRPAADAAVALMLRTFARQVRP
jgi:hypothetical protein